MTARTLTLPTTRLSCGPLSEMPVSRALTPLRQTETSVNASRLLAVNLTSSKCSFQRERKNLLESVGLLIKFTVMRVVIPLPTDQRS